MTHAAEIDHAEALTLLEQLVGFDTVSANSNLPLVDHVEAYLGRFGVECVRVPNAEGDKAALFATIGPKADGGVLLSGHTDVVPVKDQSWSSDPFRLRAEAGRLYGRGACDMKGFDAVCLAMVPAFQQARLKTPIHFLFSYDEEIGCLGSLDAIARFGVDLPRPAIAIVGEPTEMGVVGAHKGKASYVTTVYGREAHSSDPEAGANAVEAACALVTDLYRLQDELEAQGDPTGLFKPAYSTVHVGTIEGGNALNILARRCAFAWEFRGLPGVDQRLALTRLEAHVASVVLPRLKRYAAEARIETEASPEVPALAAAADSPAETLAKRLTRSNATSTVSFMTEAGQFQKAGLSTVVCGPGSIKQAHQPDEFIEIDQIDACLAFMHRLAGELSR